MMRGPLIDWRMQIGGAHDGGLGRATPAVQQLLQTVATIATSSLYNDVRAQRRQLAAV